MVWVYEISVTRTEANKFVLCASDNRLLVPSLGYPFLLKYEYFWNFWGCGAKPIQENTKTFTEGLSYSNNIYKAIKSNIFSTMKEYDKPLK